MRSKNAVAKASRELRRHLTASVEKAQRQHTLTLGLDVSSSCTGFTILTPKGALVRCGFIDLRKCNSTLQAATVVEQELEDLKQSVLLEAHEHLSGISTVHENSIAWRVGIEDYMKGFGTAKFHTRGLFKLAQLNGIVSYQCNKIFLTHCLTQKDDSIARKEVAESQSANNNETNFREPKLFMPNAIRAFHGLKAPQKASKSKAKGIKQVVFDRAYQELPTDTWRYGVRGGFQQSNYDVADSYFVAKFTLKDWLRASMLRDAELIDTTAEKLQLPPLEDVIDHFLQEGRHLRTGSPEDP